MSHKNDRLSPNKETAADANQRHTLLGTAILEENTRLRSGVKGGAAARRCQLAWTASTLLCDTYHISPSLFRHISRDHFIPHIERASRDDGVKIDMGIKSCVIESASLSHALKFYTQKPVLARTYHHDDFSGKTSSELPGVSLKPERKSCHAN